MVAKAPSCLRPSLSRAPCCHIHARVKQVATDPERFSVRLVNSPHRRIRVGDWRVIIHIDRGAIQVIIIEIKQRSVAYE